MGVVTQDQVRTTVQRPGGLFIWKIGLQLGLLTLPAEPLCLKLPTSEGQPFPFPIASFLISRVVIRDKNVHYPSECLQ